MTKITRPKELFGKTTQADTGCGPMYVTINCDQQQFAEVFIKLGKAGGCAYAQNEALSVMIAMALQLGASFPQIIKALGGIKCARTNSCAEGVAQVFKEELERQMEDEE